MKFIKALSICGIALAGIGLITARSFAQSAQIFAQFNSTGSFTYTNEGVNSYFTGTEAVSSFSFAIPTTVSPTLVNGVYPVSNVYMTITATASGPATTAGGFGTTTVTQPFSNILFTYSQGSGTPTAANTIFTADVTGGGLSFGGTSGGLTLQTNPQTPTQTFTYSSPYLEFASLTDQSPAILDVSFNPVVNGSPDKGVIIQPTGQYAGYLESFTSPATGSFSVAPKPAAITPEPSAAISVSIALLCLLCLVTFRATKVAKLARINSK